MFASLQRRQIIWWYSLDSHELIRKYHLHEIYTDDYITTATESNLYLKRYMKIMNFNCLCKVRVYCISRNIVCMTHLKKCASRIRKGHQGIIYLMYSYHQLRLFPRIDGFYNFNYFSICMMKKYLFHPRWKYKTVSVSALNHQALITLTMLTKL